MTDPQDGKIEINSGRPVIQLNGHDGFWYEQQDFWSKYLRRPMNTLGDICFAQFAKMYRSFSQSRSSDDQDGSSDAKEMDNDIDDDGYETAGDDDTDDKFNYIMTHETENLGELKKGKKFGKLPTHKNCGFHSDCLSSGPTKRKANSQSREAFCRLKYVILTKNQVEKLKKRKKYGLSDVCGDFFVLFG